MARKNKIAEPKTQTAAQLAGQLYSIKMELDPLTTAYDATKKALFEAMKSEGKKSEDVFHISRRDDIVITDKTKALFWASQHNALKIDTSIVRKVVSDPHIAFPFDNGFDIKTVEFIRVGKEDADV